MPTEKDEDFHAAVHASEALLEALSGMIENALRLIRGVFQLGVTEGEGGDDVVDDRGQLTKRRSQGLFAEGVLHEAYFGLNLL